MKLFLTLTTTVLLASQSSALMGSCRAAKKCCEGKDPDCVVQKADINSIILDPEDEPCYCDHNCLNMGDCCHDFKDYCGVFDCSVSSWSSWGSCSSQCGTGRQTRMRKVTRGQSNGGAPCPLLSELQRCTGHATCAPDATSIRGKSHRHHKSANTTTFHHHKSSNSTTFHHHRHNKAAARETAMLLPGKYSQRRLHEGEYEVRANLKTFVPKEENTGRYCVVFRVEKAMKACARHKEGRALQRGEEVCVSCESKASRPHLGDRCSGHGVTDKMTRFKNVITPGCHGRWTRIQVSDSCPCKGGPDFIFV